MKRLDLGSQLIFPVLIYTIFTRSMITVFGQAEHMMGIIPMMLFGAAIIFVIQVWKSLHKKRRVLGGVAFFLFILLVSPLPFIFAGWIVQIINAGTDAITDPVTLALMVKILTLMNAVTFGSMLSSKPRTYAQTFFTTLLLWIGVELILGLLQTYSINIENILQAKDVYRGIYLTFAVIWAGYFYARTVKSAKLTRFRDLGTNPINSLLPFTSMVGIVLTLVLFNPFGMNSKIIVTSWDDLLLHFSEYILKFADPADFDVNDVELDGILAGDFDAGTIMTVQSPTNMPATITWDNTNVYDPVNHTWLYNDSVSSGDSATITGYKDRIGLGGPRLDEHYTEYDVDVTWGSAFRTSELLSNLDTFYIDTGEMANRWENAHIRKNETISFNTAKLQENDTYNYKAAELNFLPNLDILSGDLGGYETQIQLNDSFGAEGTTGSEKDVPPQYVNYLQDIINAVETESPDNSYYQTLLGVADYLVGNYEMPEGLLQSESDTPMDDFFTLKTGGALEMVTAYTLAARLLGSPTRLTQAFFLGPDATFAADQWNPNGMQNLEVTFEDFIMYPEIYNAEFGWVSFFTPLSGMMAAAFDNVNDNTETDPDTPAGEQPVEITVDEDMIWYEQGGFFFVDTNSDGVANARIKDGDTISKHPVIEDLIIIQSSGITTIVMNGTGFGSYEDPDGSGFLNRLWDLPEGIDDNVPHDSPETADLTTKGAYIVIDNDNRFQTDENKWGISSDLNALSGLAPSLKTYYNLDDGDIVKDYGSASQINRTLFGIYLISKGYAIEWNANIAEVDTNEDDSINFNVDVGGVLTLENDTDLRFNTGQVNGFEEVILPVTSSAINNGDNTFSITHQGLTSIVPENVAFVERGTSMVLDPIFDGIQTTNRTKVPMGTDITKVPYGTSGNAVSETWRLAYTDLTTIHIPTKYAAERVGNSYTIDTDLDGTLNVTISNTGHIGVYDTFNFYIDEGSNGSVEAISPNEQSLTNDGSGWELSWGLSSNVYSFASKAPAPIQLGVVIPSGGAVIDLDNGYYEYWLSIEDAEPTLTLPYGAEPSLDGSGNWAVDVDDDGDIDVIVPAESKIQLNGGLYEIQEWSEFWETRLTLPSTSYAEATILNSYKFDIDFTRDGTVNVTSVSTMEIEKNKEYGNYRVYDSAVSEAQVPADAELSKGTTGWDVDINNNGVYNIHLNWGNTLARSGSNIVIQPWEYGQVMLQTPDYSTVNMSSNTEFTIDTNADGNIDYDGSVDLTDGYIFDNNWGSYTVWSFYDEHFYGNNNGKIREYKVEWTFANMQYIDNEWIAEHEFNILNPPPQPEPTVAGEVPPVIEEPPVTAQPNVDDIGDTTVTEGVPIEVVPPLPPVQTAILGPLNSEANPLGGGAPLAVKVAVGGVAVAGAGVGSYFGIKRSKFKKILWWKSLSWNDKVQLEFNNTLSMISELSQIDDANMVERVMYSQQINRSLISNEDLRRLTNTYLAARFSKRKIDKSDYTFMFILQDKINKAKMKK